MKDFIKSLSSKTFFMTTIAASACGDILYSIYLYVNFSSLTKFSNLMGPILNAQGYQLEQIDEEFLLDQFQLFQKSIIFFLVIILFFQILSYIFFALKKPFAKKYLLSMSWLGFIFSGLMVYSLTAPLSWVVIPFALQTFFYLWIILAIKFREDLLVKA